MTPLPQQFDGRADQKAKFMTENHTEAQLLPVVAEPQVNQSITLFGGSPTQVLEKAAVVASALRDVIRKQGLVSNIQGKEYPRCEAWTLLGTMIGVYPVCVWSRPVESGWEARVEARTRDGAIVGAAEAQCLKTEKNWSNRDDFALRSMAQTRATAKALRMPLGFVMTLSGFEATPAEEMTHDMAKRPPKEFQSARPASDPKTPARAPSATNTGNLGATQEQRNRFLSCLKPIAPYALQYAVKEGWILDTETLDDIPQAKVPTTQKQFQAIMDAIKEMMDGDQIPGAEAENQEFAIKGGNEWWRSVIIPIPPKGMKRDEYLKNPRTINELEKNTLFGYWANFQPKSWTGRDGQEHPPSDADIKFREALDEAGKHYSFTKKD